MFREGLEDEILLGFVKVEEPHKPPEFVIGFLLDAGGADSQFFGREWTTQSGWRHRIRSGGFGGDRFLWSRDCGLPLRRGSTGERVPGAFDCGRGIQRDGVLLSREHPATKRGNGAGERERDNVSFGGHAGDESKTAQNRIRLVSEEGFEFFENVLAQLFAADFEEYFLLIAETGIARKSIMRFQ